MNTISTCIHRHHQWRCQDIEDSRPHLVAVSGSELLQAMGCEELLQSLSIHEVKQISEQCRSIG